VIAGIRQDQAFARNAIESGLTDAEFSRPHEFTFGLFGQQNVMPEYCDRIANAKLLWRHTTPLSARTAYGGNKVDSIRAFNRLGFDDSPDISQIFTHFCFHFDSFRPGNGVIVRCGHFDWRVRCVSPPRRNRSSPCAGSK
jgi:hypothetical protein